MDKKKTTTTFKQVKPGVWEIAFTQKGERRGPGLFAKLLKKESK